MYSRNYLYLTDQEQEKISDLRILIAGCGLGSNIAECAVRLGFTKLTLIDGDVVELSNLNRQQYQRADLDESKVASLAKRLLAINPGLELTVYDCFLTESNISEYVKECDVVINTIDFNSHAPFMLDDYCVKQEIMSLHPYNLGWAACVFVVGKGSEDLSWISSEYEGFELKVASYFIDKIEEMGSNCDWLKDMLSQYSSLPVKQSPPQLPVGSYLNAAKCVELLSLIALGKELRYFPEIYYVN